MCLRCGAPGPAPASDAAWTVERPFRLAVSIDAGGRGRGDLPLVVEVPGDAPLEDSVVVVEVDPAGHALPDPVRAQLDLAGEGPAELTLLVPGPTAPGVRRRFLAYFATAGAFPARDPGPGIGTHPWAGEGIADGLEIATAAGTWIFDRRGAGFASLVDRDGNDWLGFHPGGGPAGEFRGLPNLAHPEGYFHPGGSACETRLTAAGPLRVRLDSTCGDGAWATRWDVFDRFARLTVQRAEHPFWLLYEGTPGGKLDPQDFAGRSDGSRRPAAGAWDDDLPDPEWAYFGDPAAGRVLWLAHLEGDDHPDAYYPMKGEMTVFGFGRRRLEKFLTPPATLVAGFVESTDHAVVAETVASATAPLTVQIGPVESRLGR